LAAESVGITPVCKTKYIPSNIVQDRRLVTGADVEISTIKSAQRSFIIIAIGKIDSNLIGQRRVQYCPVYAIRSAHIRALAPANSRPTIKSNLITTKGKRPYRFSSDLCRTIP
jgi:hypothetical protein